MFCMHMTLSTYAWHACERGGAAQQRVYPDFEASRSVIIARAKQHFFFVFRRSLYNFVCMYNCHTPEACSTMHPFVCIFK